MSASQFETVLARAAVVLAAALPECQVDRRRLDAYAPTDLPACELYRDAASADRYGDNADRWQAVFRISFLAAGSSLETALDALHVRADAALLADAELARLGRGLRCTGTAEPEPMAGDADYARMTVSYEIQLLTRRGNLAHHLT